MRWSRARGIAFVAAGVTAVVFVVAASSWTSEYRDRDFFQFYAGGRALLEGASPYDLSWWTAFHESHSSRAVSDLRQMYPGATWTTPYPVWVFVLALPFALLPLDAAASAWLVLQLLGVAAGVAALMRALALTRDRAALAVGALLVLIFPATLYLTWTGNVTGFVFTALAFATSFALRGRYVAAGAALAFVAIKPQSLVVAALALVLGAPAAGRRPIVCGGALVGAILVVGSFAPSPTWLAAWLASAGAMQSAVGSAATGWALGRVLGVAAVAPLSVAAVLLAFLAWWWMRRPAYPALLAAALPVSVFVAPYGWVHEHLYLLVSAMLLLSLLPEDRQRRSRALGVFLLAFVALPWTALLVPRNEAPSALVPLACFAVVLWLERESTRGEVPATATRRSPRVLAGGPGGSR